MHPFVVPAIVSGPLAILVLHWVPRLYIKRVDRIRQAAATVPLAPAVQLLTVPRTSERRKRSREATERLAGPQREPFQADVAL